MTAKEGTDVILTCHIKADSRVKSTMVKWLRDNQTVVKSKTIDNSAYPSPVNGCVFINETLHLQSIRLNHSGMYYCTAHMNLPMLGSVKYGKGTHVYVGELYFFTRFIILILFCLRTENTKHFFRSQCTPHFLVPKKFKEQSK